jgi:hypothetical protein
MSGIIEKTSGIVEIYKRLGFRWSHRFQRSTLDRRILLCSMETQYQVAASVRSSLVPASRYRQAPNNCRESLSGRITRHSEKAGSGVHAGAWSREPPTRSRLSLRRHPAVWMCRKAPADESEDRLIPIGLAQLPGLCENHVLSAHSKRAERCTFETSVSGRCVTF